MELNSSLTIKIIFPAIFKSTSSRSRSKIKTSLQDTLGTVGRHFVFHEDWRELIQAWELGTVFLHHLGYPSEKTHSYPRNPRTHKKLRFFQRGLVKRVFFDCICSVPCGKWTFDYPRNLFVPRTAKSLLPGFFCDCRVSFSQKDA